MTSHKNLNEDKAIYMVCFFIECEMCMNGQAELTRFAKNFLPILFNLYTNDQILLWNAERFIYADDHCVASQADNFKEVEETLN